MNKLVENDNPNPIHKRQDFEKRPRINPRIFAKALKTTNAMNRTTFHHFRKPIMTAANLTVLTIFLAASIPVQQRGDWKAPAEADTLKNPVAGQQEAIQGGKKMYAALCVICHGESGKGDGVAGAALNPKPTNLTTTAFHAQSDGAIFWKITEGRAPMASYKATLSEEKRWQLVSYLRTLKQ